MYYLLFILFAAVVYAKFYDFELQDENYYFLQITDLHIQDPTINSRYENFRTFLKIVLPVLDPLFVINTGDSCHSRNDYGPHVQIEDEWKLYRSALEEFGYYNQSYWFDVRGNHDAIATENHNESYYHRHSVTGHFGRGEVYGMGVKTPLRNYTFIGFDCPLYYCPIKPFCLYGSSDHNRFTSMSNILDRPSNFTILFTHHPDGMINTISPENKSENLRDLYHNKKVDLLLCGHIHDTMGKHLFFHRGNYPEWEWELIDWKYNNALRIVGVDNGRIAFTDFSLFEVLSSPISVITYPTDAYFPFKRTNESICDEIRFYVFSLEELESVIIKIDNGLFKFVTLHNSTFYRVKWNATLYKDNKVHKISIVSCNVKRACYTEDRQFIIERTDNDYHWKQNIITLMIKSVSWPWFMFSIYILLYSVCVSLFIIYPNMIYYMLLKKKKITKKMTFDEVDKVLYEINYVKTLHLPEWFGIIPIWNKFMRFYTYRTVLFNINKMYIFYKWFFIILPPFIPLATLNHDNDNLSIAFPIGMFYPYRHQYFTQSLECTLWKLMEYPLFLLESYFYFIFFSQLYLLERKSQEKNSHIYQLGVLIKILLLAGVILTSYFSKEFFMNGFLTTLSSSWTLFVILHWYCFIRDFVLHICSSSSKNGIY